MSNKKHQPLGKGLAALLGGSHQAKSISTVVLRELALEKIRPGSCQPRAQIAEAELSSLADSIRAQGVLQPIMVNQCLHDSELYEIIAGERRWRAAQLAGLRSIPAIVKGVSEHTAMAIALIENIQRENLSALEEARALERLSRECKLSHEQVAEAVGRSRSTVTNLLRLLHLPESIQEQLAQKRLDPGHAKLLLGLNEADQLRVAEIVVAQGLSVRETEKLLLRLQGIGAKLREPTETRRKDPDVQRLQQTLSEKLGAKVELLHQPKGKGRLVIHYHSLEILDGILAHIQ